jgi:hypothetical protein
MALMSWATPTLQWPVQRACEAARRSESLKAGLSSNCRLQLACMKPELLVTAGQHTAVNMFPGLVHTARQVTKVGNTRSQCANRKGAAVEGRVGDWD